MENATSSPLEEKKRHSPFSENENLIFRSRLSPLYSLAFTTRRFFYLQYLVASDFIAGTFNKFSKCFSEIHSPESAPKGCHNTSMNNVP
jgi:hypothetical protein